MIQIFAISLKLIQDIQTIEGTNYEISIFAENITSPLGEFCYFMNEMKPNIYTRNRKLICDWKDKKNYLVQYWLLKFHVRHGMMVDKFHEKISFIRRKWLEKIIKIKAQKTNEATNDFQKDFYKLINNAFVGKTMENEQNRIKMKLNFKK